MILGVIIMKRKYELKQYLAVIMITVGICMCTLASSKEVAKKGEQENNHEYINFLWWILGKYSICL